MAYERNLFKKDDLNPLQERLLISVIIQQREEKLQNNENDLEKLIMIHRPEIWQKMQEERLDAEELGFDEIVSQIPQSPVELIEMDDLFNDSFESIDFSLLGDEE